MKIGDVLKALKSLEKRYDKLVKEEEECHAQQKYERIVFFEASPELIKSKDTYDFIGYVLLLVLSFVVARIMLNLNEGLYGSCHCFVYYSNLCNPLYHVGE